MFEKYEGYDDNSRFKNAVYSLLVDINNKLDSLSVNNACSIIDEQTITIEEDKVVEETKEAKPKRKKATKVVKDNG